jgi:hypothetical protein
MKVKIGSYPNRLICNIHSNHMNKKYGYNGMEGNQSYEDHVLEAIDDGIQRVYDVFNWIWFDRRTQQIKVRIDPQDTWSMDHTLAHIITPMLVQLKRTHHGAPSVDNADVPEELRSTSAPPKENEYDTDSNHHLRWDWILDEMIWAFNQKCRDHWEDDYYGDYVEDQKNGSMAGSFEWVDHEGQKAHQERMSNGFRLFGKYYENLWD